MTANALPLERPEGEQGWTTVAADWTVTGNYIGGYVGGNILEVPGIDEALGDDYRFVMETRQPIRVRRFWCGNVWDVTITPADGGGIRSDYTVLLKLKRADTLSFTRLSAFLIRALEVLTDGANETRHLPPAVAGQPPAPSARLRVVPDEL